MQTSQNSTRRLRVLNKLQTIKISGVSHTISSEGLEVPASYNTPKYYFHASLLHECRENKEAVIAAYTQRNVQNCELREISMYKSSNQIKKVVHRNIL